MSELSPYVPALTQVLSQMLTSNQIGEFLSVYGASRTSAELLAISLYTDPDRLSSIAYNPHIVYSVYQILGPNSFDIATSDRSQWLLDRHASYLSTLERRYIVTAIDNITVTDPLLVWFKSQASRLDRDQLDYLLARLQQGVIVTRHVYQFYPLIDVITIELQRELDSYLLEELYEKLYVDGFLSSIDEDETEQARAIASVLISQRHRLLAYPQLLEIYDDVLDVPSLPSDYQEAYATLNNLSNYRLSLIAKLFNIRHRNGNLGQSMTPSARAELIDDILRKLVLVPEEQVLTLPYPLPRAYQLLKDMTAVIPLHLMDIPDLIKLYRSLGGEQEFETKEDLINAINKTTTVTSVYDQWMEMLEEYPGDKVARMLEMIPPPNVDIDEYVNRNLISYLPAIVEHSDIPILDNRNIDADTLSHYTDVELFNQLKAIVPYSSRTELVENLARLFLVATFFIPIQPCRGEVAYGTITSYDCYTEEQLLRFIDNGRVKIPKKVEGQITIAEVSLHHLKRLVDFSPQLRLLRLALPNLM